MWRGCNEHHLLFIWWQLWRPVMSLWGLQLWLPWKSQPRKTSIFHPLCRNNEIVKKQILQAIRKLWSDLTTHLLSTSSIVSICCWRGHRRGWAARVNRNNLCCQMFLSMPPKLAAGKIPEWPMENTHCKIRAFPQARRILGNFKRRPPEGYAVNEGLQADETYSPCWLTTEQTKPSTAEHYKEDYSCLNTAPNFDVYQ